MQKKPIASLQHGKFCVLWKRMYSTLENKKIFLKEQIQPKNYSVDESKIHFH